MCQRVLSDLIGIKQQIEKLGNPNYLETKKYECSQPWGKEHIDMEIRKYFSLNMMKTQLAERN